MRRQWNASIYFGFLIVVFAFLSYFLFFSQFPLTRDVPWLNLLLFVPGFVLLWRGTRRARREPARYRGRIVGPLLAALSVLLFALFISYNFYLSAQLPPSKGAPKVGERAPDFTLLDQNGKPVKLADLHGQPVLLVFYRGYW